MRNTTAERANEILGQFATVPDSATCVQLDYTPFAAATIEFDLSAAETRKWCEENGWTISPDSNGSAFEFNALQETGWRGGRWSRGRVIFVVY